MFLPKTAIIASIAAAVLLAGCGKQPATSAGVNLADVEERVTPHVPVLTSSTNKKVGVYVDGRWYAKGEEPTAKTAAAPAAPAPGTGHLHVTLSLKGVSGFTGSMAVRLKNSEDREVSIHTFAKAELVGKSVQCYLTDVPAGAYVMYVNGYNSSGGVYSETAYDVEIVEDRTIESAI
ncbi:MAG: hypothetical protein JWM80_1108 [Cyanobacteria bacterium RYN_339]|nr:hypothetical protein [Cyanobacteria bacterium RYN_339]